MLIKGIAKDVMSNTQGPTLRLVSSPNGATAQPAVMELNF
jgi:hypothetical protein